MTISIPFGWWLAPAILTIFAYAVAWWQIPKPQPSSYMPDVTPAIVGLVTMFAATIVSLAAWLAWALLT